jgi:hypothetical protein
MVVWVLWSELLGDGKPEWNYIDAFSTEAACTEEIAAEGFQGEAK